MKPMRATVLWNEEPEQKLANYWLSEPGRGGITAASNWIDHALRSNPLIGELQGEQFYLRRDPLEIWYVYSPLDCKVTVVEVNLVD